jgi:hypothetical protein
MDSSSKTSQNSCSLESQMTTVSVSLDSKTFCTFSLPSRTSPATLASCCNLPNSACKKIRWDRCILCKAWLEWVQY